MKKFKIIVDADSCPFKDGIIEVARKYGIELYFVFSISHISRYPDDVKTVIVDNRKEAADLAVVNLATNGDLVVTQDYGLGAMALTKKSKVLLINGTIVDQNNIDQLLEFRHMSAKNRKNRVKIKGPKKIGPAERDFFLKQLVAVIEEILGDD